MKFLLILILLPAIEIYFFVKIGSEIGAISTILFTLLTAFLGIATVKYQGISSFMQARQSVMNTSQPGIEILSNLSLFISGAFLLLPGFFTDFLGILILFPPLRIILIKSFIARAASKYRKSHQNNNKNKDYIDIDPDN
jgi:UPF0716 protein FxsA|tara:strand:- start:134 stop:550 length:417 start_codon:yes stop_codon:yes gene_type:complete